MTWRMLPLALVAFLATAGLAVAQSGEPGSTSCTSTSSGEDCSDSDADSVPNDHDNCPEKPNKEQADLDQDGLGDACDEDLDGDGVTNGTDNCPRTANQEQKDADNDKVGDACDTATQTCPNSSCPPPCGTPEKPCPSGCQANTPCSDPGFQECIRTSNKTADDEQRCKDDYCERVHNDWCAKYTNCREHPGTAGCPVTCQPFPPCTDAAYRECMQKPDPTVEDAKRCRDEYCSRAKSDWCAKETCQSRPTASGCSDKDDGRDCLAKAERGDPQAKECKDFCAKHPDECQRFCSNHPDIRLCAIAPKGDEKHITFEPLPDGLANLTVKGHLILASVRMEATEAIESSHNDHTLKLKAGKNVLELHDASSGFLRFEGPDATVTLTFPAGVTHTLGQGPRSGASKVSYPDGGLAMIESDGLSWVDDQTVVVTQFMSFHVVSGQFNPAGPADAAVREKIKQAKEAGDKVGAEISVNKKDCSKAGEDGQAVQDGEQCSEVFAYDRVKVKMKLAAGVPTANDPLQITLSSDLPEGRAFVLHINKTVLDVEAGKVQLRYFDLPDGENSTTKTEVIFRPATDLDDILDATDDDGQPEYYIVRDENGLQVLVTVPHWSVHMIELSSLAELVQPSVLIGIAAGAAGIAIAAVALFVPRRRDEL